LGTFVVRLSADDSLGRQYGIDHELVAFLEVFFEAVLKIENV
jgi:hypothetical protein